MTKAARGAPAEPERTGPPIDLARIGDQLILLMSLPGVKPPDLRVSLVGDRQLFLEGNVAYRHPLPREGLALNERAYGPFSRTIQLPLPVDPGRVAVSFKDGVLKVDLPIRTTAVQLSWQAKEVMSDGRPG
jgi:HSP20 family protein